MFVNLKIKNIGGIKELVDLDFISRSRNKSQMESCIKTPDDIYINKQIAFIGSNASGKSSILKAISSVGDFICAALFRKRILDEIDSSDNTIFYYKKIINQLSVIKNNVNTSNEKSYFLADMFITADEQTTGYYKYELEFDDEMQEKGVIKEILTYRKEYNSKKEFEISNKVNIKESQIGYVHLYGNNMGYDNDRMKYIDTFLNHYITFSKYIQADSIEFEYDKNISEWVNKSPEEVIRLVKMFNSNIARAEIAKDKFDNDRLYFYTDCGSKLEYDELSNGTKKLMVVIYQVLQTVKNNGVCLIDEIEMGLYKELVNFILKIFYAKNSYAQIIFTSNYPEILDEKFKFDQIFCLKKEYDTTRAVKLKDLILDGGKKVRFDMSLAKAYANGLITLHPTEEMINEYIKNMKFDF